VSFLDSRMNSKKRFQARRIRCCRSLALFRGLLFLSLPPLLLFFVSLFRLKI
jgi:hypothetical protein